MGTGELHKSKIENFYQSRARAALHTGQTQAEQRQGYHRVERVQEVKARQRGRALSL